MEIGFRISQLLDSIRLSSKNSQHLSHSLIRVERVLTEYSSSLDSSRSISTEEREKSSRKLKSILLELIEVLGEEKNTVLSQLEVQVDSQTSQQSPLASTTSSQIYDRYNVWTSAVHDIVINLDKATTIPQASLTPGTPERRRKAPPATTTQSPPETTSISIDSLLALTSQPSNNVFPSKALADVFALYSLANFPSKILPPGNTLSSLLKAATAEKGKQVEVLEEDVNSLEARVRRTVESAYFDNIKSILSSINSSQEEKNSLWYQCLNDLWEASSSLIPSRIKEKAALQIEFTLISNFSLPVATSTLHHLMSTLAKLTAPIRDTQVYELLSSISLPSSTPTPSSSTVTPTTKLSSLLLPSPALTVSELISAVQSTLAFTKIMQSDLDQFKKNLVQATPPTEYELNGLVAFEAKRREREVVERYYQNLGLELNKEMRDWIRRNGGSESNGSSAEATNLSDRSVEVSNGLVGTIFAEVAVEFPSSSSNSSSTLASSTNVLPPIFIIPSPTIYRLQNQVQALIILACLLSLAPTSTEATAERLWTILTFDLSSSTAATSEDTKLINLSDEIIRSTMESNNFSDPEKLEIEIDRIRKGVDRIIKYTDPVFGLLRTRLLLAMKEGLQSTCDSNLVDMTDTPAIMRTGRTIGSTPSEITAAPEFQSRVFLPLVKGFDRYSVFTREMLIVAQELESVLNWSLDTWGDVI